MSGKAAKSSGWFINLVCFIAVICIGVSLFLSKIGLSGQISGALTIIAQVIAYLVVIVISGFYISKRRVIWLWVIWAISVALIVISYFLH